MEKRINTYTAEEYLEAEKQAKEAEKMRAKEAEKMRAQQISEAIEKVTKLFTPECITPEEYARAMEIKHKGVKFREVHGVELSDVGKYKKILLPKESGEKKELGQADGKREDLKIIIDAPETPETRIVQKNMGAERYGNFLLEISQCETNREFADIYVRYNKRGVLKDYGINVKEYCRLYTPKGKRGAYGWSYDSIKTLIHNIHEEGKA